MIVFLFENVKFSYCVSLQHNNKHTMKHQTFQLALKTSVLVTTVTVPISKAKITVFTHVLTFREKVRNENFFK